MTATLTDNTVHSLIGSYQDYDRHKDLVVEYHETGILLIDYKTNGTVVINATELLTLTRMLKDTGYIE